MHLHGSIVEFARVLSARHVRRGLDQRRSRTSVLHLREGAAEHLRDARGVADVPAPLRDPAVVAHGVESGMNAESVAVMSARQHEERHVVREPLRDATEGVLGPRTALHGEHPNLPAVHHAAVPVRHVHARALLSRDDGTYPLHRHGVYQRLRWKCRHPLHTLGLQNLRYSPIAVHAILLKFAISNASAHHSRELQGRHPSQLTLLPPDTPRNWFLAQPTRGCHSSENNPRPISRRGDSRIALTAVFMIGGVGDNRHERLVRK